MSYFKKISLALVALAVLSSTSANAEPVAPATTTPATTAPASALATTTPAKPKTKLKMAANETIIYVDDLHCGHCAKKIASKLYAVKGVILVRTDVKADIVIITPQAKKKLDPLALWKAAKDSTFPALRLEGPTGKYVADPKTQAPQLVPEKTVAPKS